MATIQVESDFAWVILAATSIALQIIFQGFEITPLRKKYFVELGVADEGYPDMGNGRYAAKLSDEAWFEFNCYQRAHYNYLEVVASVLTFELLGGLFYPRFSAGLGFLYVFSRILYAWGYRTKGPKGRRLGALIGDAALLALAGTTIIGALKLGRIF